MQAAKPAAVAADTGDAAAQTQVPGASAAEGGGGDTVAAAAATTAAAAATAATGRKAAGPGSSKRPPRVLRDGQLSLVPYGWDEKLLWARRVGSFIRAMRAVLGDRSMRCRWGRGHNAESSRSSNVLFGGPGTVCRAFGRP